MKAQVALEYIMITGFVIMLLIPTVYFLIEYTSEARQDVAESRLQEIGTKIITNSESIFYFGKHSKITLDVLMPEGLLNMTVQCTKETPDKPAKSHCELVFEMQDEEIVFPSRFPIVGKELDRSTTDRYVYKFPTRSFREGKKQIILETLQQVNVSNNTLFLECSSTTFDPGEAHCNSFEPSSRDVPVCAETCDGCPEYCRFTSIHCNDDAICEQYGAGKCIGASPGQHGDCVIEGAYIEMRVE